MKITVEKDECPLGSEPLFKKIWPGTVAGCYWYAWTTTDKYGSKKVKLTKAEEWAFTEPSPYPTRKIRERGRCWENSERFPPRKYEEMTKIGDISICGWRASTSFEEAIRPSPSNGLCPDDTVPCST